jgi:hypothetical protein
MRFTASLLLALLSSSAVLGACASGARSGSRVAGNPNLITRSEIDEARQSGVRDLYELIERRRPRWLQARAERSINLQTSILVFQNNSRLGGIDALRGYPLGSITSIRYLDAAQAGLLPGGGGAHVEGAIVISTAIGNDAP